MAGAKTSCGPAGYEVLVIGAGPAGGAAARWLALAGRRVLLLDPAEAGEKIGESLPGVARPLLRDLGLLPFLDRSEPLACPGNRSAWEGEALVDTDFLRDPHGSGWHLDRPLFDLCLREAAQEAGAEWRRQRLEGLARGPRGWRVRLGESEVTARWLIDASGRARVAARRLGFERRREEAQVAVYAFAADGGDGDARTVIERVAGGWWYTAPLPKSRRVAAFHTDPREAARLLRAPGAFAEKLAATRHLCRFCPPDAVAAVRPAATDAGGSRLEKMAGEEWLAVGDAALTFDPLSSQGIFNALYTGLRGAQAAHAALAGDCTAVQRYAERLETVWATYRGRLEELYRRPVPPVLTGGCRSPRALCGRGLPG
jgi:flavin-dependent dehydrogenase